MTTHLAVIASAAKQSRATAAVFAVLLPTLAACVVPEITPQQPAAYTCLLPSEQRMLVAELFFGRNVRGRGPVTDAEWAEFAAQTITPAFPDGFTAFDAEGQWQNPATGAIFRGRTKVLLIAAKRSSDLPARLTAVMEAYKARFQQQSVGIITRDACGSF